MAILFSGFFMRSPYCHQRGFSLSSIIAVGVIVVLALAYARGFIQIPYTKYKVNTIVASILKEGTTKPSDIKSLFNSRVMFEGISGVVNADNLTIESTERNVQIKVDYEHCEPLWTHWTVCAEVLIEKQGTPTP